MSGRGLVRYDARLVEEAVLLEVREQAVPVQERFRSRRDALYVHRDGEEREAAFEALHGEWFVCLGLDRPLHRALSERPEVMRAVSECRVLPARSRREEMADLLGRETSEGGRVLVVRLRPESFLDEDGLLAFLRREVLHVADMLDPAFGYRTRLPESEAGPSFDNILRDRYRAVWATTVDGRLVRQGLCPATARESRRSDFARAFGSLGDRADEGFVRWFEEPGPTHSAIVDYIRTCGADGSRLEGRCPLCHFPGLHDPHAGRLSPGALREIEAEHPSWRPDHGICPQCADLYLARAAPRRETGRRSSLQE